MPYGTAAADAVAANALARADRQTLAVFAAGQSSGIALCRPATTIRRAPFSKRHYGAAVSGEGHLGSHSRDDRHVDHLQKRLGSAAAK
jgi:hypothetical protein